MTPDGETPPWQEASTLAMSQTPRETALIVLTDSLLKIFINVAPAVSITLSEIYSSLPPSRLHISWHQPRKPVSLGPEFVA
jgi:hypothetical protein